MQLLKMYQINILLINNKLTLKIRIRNLLNQIQSQIILMNLLKKYMKIMDLIIITSIKTQKMKMNKMKKLINENLLIKTVQHIPEND